MKIWKLVSGIISIVLTVMVLFQSCASGLGDALENKGGTSGASGMIVAALMLAGGIVSVVVRDSISKGAHVSLVVLFGLAALVGYASVGMFKDLKIWATWCLICAVLAIVAMFIKPKDKTEEAE